MPETDVVREFHLNTEEKARSMHVRRRSAPVSNRFLKNAFLGQALTKKLIGAERLIGGCGSVLLVSLFCVSCLVKALRRIGRGFGQSDFIVASYFVGANY